MTSPAKGVYNNIDVAKKNPMEVTHLDLSMSRYEVVPDDIGQLANLVSLRLAWMSLPVPNWFGKLTELEHLYIDEHSFDHIPEDILKLPKLRILEIGECFEGDGITRIEDSLLLCKNLEKLDIELDEINYISSSINNHTHLKSLTLIGEKTSKFEYFPKLEQITHLDLEGFLMERMPAGLEESSALQTISLAHNNLKSFNFGLYPSLEQLNLNNNQIKKIIVDETSSKVKKLELGSNGLTLLPEEITSLIELETIDLSHNDLLKLPNSFSELEKMKTINVRNNELRQLPEDWGKMQNLETINLSNNLLRDLPSTTVDLINLKSLDLSQNKLLRLPPYMNVFERLEKLKISNNQLFSQSYSLPESMGELNSLSVLDLGNNQLEFIPEYLGKIPLNKLDLSNNSISFLPQDISGWKNMKHLYLQNNPIIKISESIEQLKELEHLNLDNVSIMSWDENLDQLSKIEGLKSLSLRFNGISTAIEGLKKFKNLEMLDLRRNSIPDEEKNKIQELLSSGCRVFL